jgi:death-on-curing protein
MIPVFLFSEEVQALHLSQVEAWGGHHGLRDSGALESAVAAPQHYFVYGTGDLFDLASALMFALITNHPFLDGNKRTGTLAAAVMLEMNGVALRADPAWLRTLEQVAWKAAKAEATREDLAAVLRDGATAIE